MDPNEAAIALREAEIKKLMGVDVNFIDPTKQNSLIRTIAPYISPAWGHSNYANAFNNTIGMDGYTPGELPYIEAHEAAHLSNEEATPAKFLGVAGRTVTGLSDRLGKPIPLELIGGGLMHIDAAEEDRAERLAAKYGPALGGNIANAPVINRGRSQYGDRLREEGQQRIAGVFKPLLDSINQAKGLATNFIQGPQRSSLESEIREAVTSFRNLSRSTNDITPELLEVSNRLDNMRKMYSDKGGNFDAFVDTIGR